MKNTEHLITQAAKYTKKKKIKVSLLAYPIAILYLTIDKKEEKKKIIK